MNPSVLLITPPFTQLNTPYPATAYLKGFLETKSIESEQVDLGISVINELFCKEGLDRMFTRAEVKSTEFEGNILRIWSLKEVYIETIEPVIAFLQNRNPTLAQSICTGNYLPEGFRFEQVSDLDWAFGNIGIQDKARHLATLYLEDLADFIQETIDPYFGFSRYAERLSRSANSFDELYDALNGPLSFIDELVLEVLQKSWNLNTDLVCISVPFPGNLYSGLRCAQFIKEKHPTVKICLGGGYANTELRQIKDNRFFEFVDFLTLDDGELCLLHLVEHLRSSRPAALLKRTFTLIDNEIEFCNGSLQSDFKQEAVGTPNYAGLPLDKYLSVIEVANPMHRLWSDGRWNKLTLAHGCYWGKCTFCDITLDYIKNYEATTAVILVDRIEQIIAQTGETGFHFVDEAAPPALMRELAIELIKRKVTITWWANIRFEKSFSADLCRLLALSGCMAVSGGLEVASDRLLALIKKGVTLAQVARVTDSFTSAGIMVHAYLMYGFPTQTDQETIDSLEVVRQLFEANVVQSGFWHQFAMTAHSPVGQNPDGFKVKALLDVPGSFAHNDISHEDILGTNHDKYSEGLKKALFNYMHGIGFEFPLQKWFSFKVKPTTVAKSYILDCIEDAPAPSIKLSTKILWLGQKVSFRNSNDIGKVKVIVYNKKETLYLDLEQGLADTFMLLVQECSVHSGYKTIQQLDELTELKSLPSLDELFAFEYFADIQAMGLLML